MLGKKSPTSGTIIYILIISFGIISCLILITVIKRDHNWDKHKKKFLIIENQEDEEPEAPGSVVAIRLDQLLFLLEQQNVFWNGESYEAISPATAGIIGEILDSVTLNENFIQDEEGAIFTPSFMNLINTVKSKYGTFEYIKNIQQFNKALDFFNSLPAPGSAAITDSLEGMGSVYKVGISSKANFSGKKVFFYVAAETCILKSMRFDANTGSIDAVNVSYFADEEDCENGTGATSQLYIPFMQSRSTGTLGDSTPRGLFVYELQTL